MSRSPDTDARAALMAAIEADLLGEDEDLHAYAQSEHCRGCAYARKLSNAGSRAPYFCAHIIITGRRRPIPADECPGFGRKE